MSKESRKERKDEQVEKRDVESSYRKHQKQQVR